MKDDYNINAYDILTSQNQMLWSLVVGTLYTYWRYLVDGRVLKYPIFKGISPTNNTGVFQQLLAPPSVRESIHFILFIAERH